MITKLKNKFNSYSDRQRKIIIIFLVIVFIGLVHKIYSEIMLHRYTTEHAQLNVATITPAHGPQEEEILLPGDVQAWHEAPVYARTNGYIKQWYTDYGAVVKEGDVLAEIEAPEIDAQLLQAKAELKRAEANYELAQITNDRWKILLQTESVSQQDADEKNSAEKANIALVEAAQAHVEYLSALVQFQKVVAPFDGIITARNIDIGSLIDAGSSSIDSPLFYIVQSNYLRVFAEVPQKYSSRLSPEMEVKLYFNEYPNKMFHARLMSTAKGINNLNRTLTAEFKVDNTDNQLLPGSYTQFHMLLPVPVDIVRLPINTILFRAQGLQVGIVNPDNTVTLKSIKVGRDFGTELEIISGITIHDQVIINPPDSLFAGQKVNVVKNSPYQSKI
jgi:RND family efflux transporter MFP subunit